MLEIRHIIFRASQYGHQVWRGFSVDLRYGVVGFQYEQSEVCYECVQMPAIDLDSDAC